MLYMKNWKTILSISFDLPSIYFHYIMMMKILRLQATYKYWPRRQAKYYIEGYMESAIKFIFGRGKCVYRFWEYSTEIVHLTMMRYE